MELEVEVEVEMKVEVEVAMDDLVEMAGEVVAKATHNDVRPLEQHVGEWRMAKCRNKMTYRCFRAT